MSEEEKQNMGVDLGEFLEFYLLDSQEQIEKLGAGLLQLEREGKNEALINEMFRSAHSLKGASGTMGFTQVVSLTHAAEDLLDRLRQGKMEVTLDVIDVLLSVTDRVKEMLAQVERREEISIEYQDILDEIEKIISSGGSKGKEKVVIESTNHMRADVPESVPLIDFQLQEQEKAQVLNYLADGHGVYQLDIKFAENTLMKAVRAVMAIQRVESFGKVVKIIPSIEDLEVGSPERFAMLITSNEPPEEIRSEISSVSELEDVQIAPYSIPEPKEPVVVQEEVAATNTVAKVEPNVEEKTKPDQEPPKPSVSSTNSTSSVNSDKSANSNDNSSPKTKTPVKSAKSTNSSNNNNITSHNQVHTIRVDTARLDNLINLVGEMVITRTRLVQIGLDLKEQYRMDSLVNSLNETNVYLGRLMNDLQESAMRLRMVPIGTVFSRFPRLVRDLARKTDKEIDLVLKGEETELDKTVVEVIGDPLMHLIRNSVDHGIESPDQRKAAGKPERGEITLEAFHEGNHISIIVRDDGKGLDLNKIRQKAVNRGLIGEREELSEREIANLIFMPGFSTVEQVTDISGRGVGMDVVKKALNNLGGTIEIATEAGMGTTFTIRLPLTLAIIQALLVEVGPEIYAVPLASVLETLLVERQDVKMVGGMPMVQLRGNTLPLISLKEKFGLEEDTEEQEEVYVVVVGLGDKQLGLVVDELRGQQEIVIKSLGDILNNIPGIAGATILGDGKVTLILDIGGLIQDALIMRKA